MDEDDHTEETTSQKTALTWYSGEANAEDALVADFYDAMTDASLYYYGSTDQNGDPIQITSYAYQQHNSDTVYNFILDDQARVSYFYQTINGQNDCFLHRIRYIGVDSAYYSIYAYDWVTFADSLLYQYSLSLSNDTVTGNKTFEYKSAASVQGLDFSDVKDGFKIFKFFKDWNEHGIDEAIVRFDPVMSAIVDLLQLTVEVITTNKVNKTTEQPAIAPPQSPSATFIKEPNGTPQQPGYCTVNMTFHTSIDSLGSIIFFDLDGGQSPYSYSIDNSPLQENPVFNGPYKPGGHLVRIVDGNGCERVEIRNITRDNSCDPNFELIVDWDDKVVRTQVVGGHPPFQYKYGSRSAAYVKDTEKPNSGEYCYVKVKDANNCTREYEEFRQKVFITKVEGDTIHSHRYEDHTEATIRILIEYTSPTGFYPTWLGPPALMDPWIVITSSSIPNVKVNYGDFCDGGGGWFNGSFLRYMNNDPYNREVAIYLPNVKMPAQIAFRLPWVVDADIICNRDEPYQTSLSREYSYSW